MPTALKVRAAFWTPDQPERRVNGELSADEHQIRVELDGSLQDIAVVASVSSRYPLLHLLIALAVIVIAFDTLVSIGVLLAYLGFCHAGLTIGPPFNGFGRC